MARMALLTGCAMRVAAVEFKVRLKTVAKWLRPWTDYYNREWSHGSLNYKPPLSRSLIGTTS